MSKISFKDVHKRFPNGAVAIERLDLEVHEGEFLVLVGPSGCGKTTALRLVAGLEELTAGEIYVGEVAVNDLAPWERNVAMVFQSYALYPHMTVAENLGYPLKVAKVHKQERERRLREVAARLGLDGLLERKPSQLSGGQRQRVAMGRAMVRRPGAFLMDEPLSNLDAQLRVEMRTDLLRLHRDVGTTTLYVTHDQTEAMTMGDRVALLRDGVLQQVGTPLDLYERPTNLFAATFIGSPAMNLFEGLVAQEGGAPVLTSRKLRIELGRNDVPPGRVIAGIRPDRLRLGGHSEKAVQAQVELVEELGSEVQLSLQAPVDPATALPDGIPQRARGEFGARFIAKASPDTALSPGENVALVLEGRHLHLFDPASGKRL